MLEEGLDSPNKRAQKYIELKDFWGGGGVTAPSMHTPRGPGKDLRLSSQSKSDDYRTELGLAEEAIQY